MSVVIYKRNGESIIVEPEYLQDNLAAGWLLDPNEPEPESVKQATTTKDIRQFAKLAGFKDWKTAKIQTLREKLGYEN